MVRATSLCEQSHDRVSCGERTASEGPIRNEKCTSHSLPELPQQAGAGEDQKLRLQTAPLGLVSFLKEGVRDLPQALVAIRARFERNRTHGEQALAARQAIGEVLARIKAGIRNGQPGFPDTDWSTWCEQARAALPVVALTCLMHNLPKALLYDKKISSEKRKFWGNSVDR